MKKRLLVSMIPAVACLAFAAPALAATQEGASENWAGYVVTSNNDSGFSAVSGQWKEPQVDCTANSGPTYSAYWVGLGGGGQQSTALEQIGTQGDCSASGAATYYAWYELVPSAPVKLSLAIHPGDSIWARTAVNGDQVSLFITDQTTHQTWSKTLTMTSATPDTSTAEWVAEAPSECAGGAMSDCTPLTLANFGTTRFSDAHTTSNGHVGSISDSNWTAEAIELEPSSSSLFGGGYGGYFQGGYWRLLRRQQLSDHRRWRRPDRFERRRHRSSASSTAPRLPLKAQLQARASRTHTGPARVSGYGSGSGSGYGSGWVVATGTARAVPTGTAPAMATAATAYGSGDGYGGYGGSYGYGYGGYGGYGYGGGWGY